MLKKYMNNFVISIIGKKDKFYNKVLGKRISPDNFYVIFQIDSLADTSKNEQIKLFEAVNKLKYLLEKNGRDNDKWKFAWEIQHSNSRNSNRKKQKKTEEDPNFLFNNNANNKSFSIEVLCLTYMFCWSKP